VWADGAQNEMLKRFYIRVTGPGLGGLVARVAGGTTLAQVASMGLALLVGIFLARILGPEGLGVYSLAIATIAVLNIPTEFSWSTYLMREAAGAHVRSDWGYLGAVFAWCTRTIFLMSLAVVIVAAAVLLFLPINHELRWTILAALLLIPLIAQSNARDLAMRGMNLQLIGQLPMLILRPGMFLVFLSLAFVALGTMSAPQAMLLHVLAMVAVVVAISILFWRNTPQVTAQPSVAFDGRAAFRAAWPMGMTEGLRVLNGHLAVFLIGALTDAGAVGLFKVADSIGMMCAMPLSILNIVAAPQIARLHAANDARRLKKLVSTVALGMTLGAASLALFVMFFGAEILLPLFGAQFARAETPMLILCLGYALGAMLGPATVFMNMTGRERTVTRGIVVSFTANLVLGAALISTLDIVGAALANVAAYFIWYGWMWWEAKRQAGVDTSLVPALTGLQSPRNRA